MEGITVSLNGLCQRTTAPSDFIYGDGLSDSFKDKREEDLND
jgi:hypothetical protein